MTHRYPRSLSRLLLALTLAASGGLRAQGAPDPLDQLNAAFRTAYGDAKARHLLGTVIVINGDQALLLRGQATVAEAQVRPPRYHRLKAVDHVALALYLKLLPLEERPWAAGAGADLARLRPLMLAARQGLSGTFPPGAALQRQERILDRSLELLDGYLKAGKGSRAALAAFVRDLTPFLMANVQDAAALQLEALDRAVSLWRKGMAPAEWDGLRVVLMGAHMPRDGEVTWQYFSRLLGQPAEGDRIIYAEGLWEVKDALDLLATHGVDQGLGAAFFGDPGRMHRDLLADAAKAWLDARFRVVKP